MHLIPDPTPRHVHGEDALTPHDLVEGEGR